MAPQQLPTATAHGTRVRIIGHDGASQFWEWESRKGCFSALLPWAARFGFECSLQVHNVANLSTIKLPQYPEPGPPPHHHGVLFFGQPPISQPPNE
jgi:hypothetical protein